LTRRPLPCGPAAHGRSTLRDFGPPPRHGTGNVTAPDGMELLRVRNIREAIQLVLS